MIKSKNEIIISILLVLIAALLVSYNVYSVEIQNIMDLRQMEEDARTESEMLEELRSRETVELAEYYQKYEPIKAEFIERTAELSEKMDDKIINTEELKELTAGRLEAAIGYKEKLAGIGNIPVPLETFSIYELEFIESDIKTINLVLSYYNSENYTNFNHSAIDKLYDDTKSLFRRAEKELHRVYEQYELEYILEGSSS